MKILVFGEILWDIFPQKKEIGGAALNFGAHLAKLGADVFIVSALGNDDLGAQSREMVKYFRIDDRYVKTIERPTGVCNVTIDGKGSPEYDLVRGVSYDYITFDDNIAVSYDAFYMGTLARRNKVSSDTFRKLITGDKYGEVFCDINIRQEFYTKEIIEESLKYSTILKISRDEAFVFHDFGIAGFDNLTELAAKLSNSYGIKLVIVTMDKDGAFLYSANTHSFIYSDKRAVKAVSTVGAGDSFSACFLYNYLRGESLNDCLNRAVILSAFVVTKLGAVPEYAEGLLESIT